MGFSKEEGGGNGWKSMGWFLEFVEISKYNNNFKTKSQQVLQAEQHAMSQASKHEITIVL